MFWMHCIVLKFVAVNVYASVCIHRVILTCTKINSHFFQSNLEKLLNTFEKLLFNFFLFSKMKFEILKYFLKSQKVYMLVINISYLVFTLVNFYMTLKYWNIVLLQRSPRCANLGLKHYMLKPIQRIPQYKLLLQGKALNSWGTMPLKQEAVIYHWNTVVLFLSALVTSVKFSPTV